MIDDELRTLLSVEPSPELETRIKARVAADASTGRWRGVGARAFAIAATLTIAVGVGLLTRHDRAAPPAPSHLLAPPIAQTPKVIAPLPAPVAADEVGHRRAQSRGRTTRPVARVVAAHVTRHVQIDRTETLALQRLFAMPVAGAVVDVAAPAADELVIPHIAIEPLTLAIRSEGAPQ